MKDALDTLENDQKHLERILEACKTLNRICGSARDTGLIINIKEMIAPNQPYPIFTASVSRVITLKGNDT